MVSWRENRWLLVGISLGITLAVVTPVLWVVLSGPGPQAPSATEQASSRLAAERREVEMQCAAVQDRYVQKLDLIPSLYNETLGYSQFERGMLEDLVRLRSEWRNTPPGELRGNIANEIDNNLVQVRQVYESYPELQSVQALRDLFDEIAGTENRITYERSLYNGRIRDYNDFVGSLPEGIALAIGANPLPFDNPVGAGCPP